MSEKIIEYSKIGALILISFLISFIEGGSLYFVISFPLLVSLVFYKNSYFIMSFFSNLVAAFLIDYTYLPFLVLFGLSLILFIFFIYRKAHINLAFLSSFISMLFGVIYSFVNYYLGKAQIYNVILIPFFMGFTTYCLSKIFIDFKSKSAITFTQLELLFLSSIINYCVFKGFSNTFGYDIWFILVSILLFMLCRVNVVCAFFEVILSIALMPPNYNELKGFLILYILVFTTRFSYKNKKPLLFLYLVIAFSFAIAINRYDYVFESLIVFIALLRISDSSLIKLEKHLVDPKDYKLNDFKEKYFKVLNHDKKIRDLMQIIEEKIKDHPRMKKKYNEQIANDLNFLITKIQNTPPIDNHQKVEDVLEEMDIDVIGFKIKEDLNDETTVFMEIRNFTDYKKISNALEEIFKTNIKMTKGKYNFITNTMTYEFNKFDNYKFEYFVRQRSVDENCGDNYLCFKVNNKRYFLISDGMGHGNKASEDSRFSLYLLKKFIELGMETERAIISCNALLYSKTDTYNTLDLLEYDGYSNKITLYKNGSGNTYVQYGNEVEKLASENLPLGIIDEINIKRLNIREGVEKIILTSDGVDTNLVQDIKENKGKSINDLVNEILMKESNVKDDQTIMAINIIKTGEVW